MDVATLADLLKEAEEHHEDDLLLGDSPDPLAEVHEADTARKA